MKKLYSAKDCDNDQLEIHAMENSTVISIRKNGQSKWTTFSIANESLGSFVAAINFRADAVEMKEGQL